VISGSLHGCELCDEKIDKMKIVFSEMKLLRRSDEMRVLEKKRQKQMRKIYQS
jgi:hypothetical protein